MNVEPPRVADQEVDTNGLKLFLEEIAGNDKTRLAKCITVEEEVRVVKLAWIVVGWTAYGKCFPTGN